MTCILRQFCIINEFGECDGEIPCNMQLDREEDDKILSAVAPSNEGNVPHSS